MEVRVYTGNDRTPRSRRRRIVEALLLVVAIYSFGGASYIALNAVFHPATLRLHLTHFAPWPHEDTFGLISFAVSFGCALAYCISRSS